MITLANFQLAKLRHQVHEAENTSASCEHDMVALYLGAQAVTHRPLHLKCSFFLGFVDLSGQSFRLSVVLDANGHFILALIVQEPHIKRLISSFALLLHCIDVGVVHFWLHSVADGVVAGNFVASIEVADQEVLANKAQIFLVVPPVVDSHTIHVLKDNRLGRGVDFLALLLHNSAYH